jgi:hypothetical protein
MPCIESHTEKQWHDSQSPNDRHNNSRHDAKLQTRLQQIDSREPKLSRSGIFERSCRCWLRTHQGETAAIRKRCEGTGGTDSPKRHPRSHEQFYCLRNEDWGSPFCSHESAADCLDYFETSKLISIFPDSQLGRSSHSVTSLHASRLMISNK